MNHISIGEIIFHKNPLYFRIYAEFEADNEKNIFCVGNKTINIYEQNPIFKGYHIESEIRRCLEKWLSQISFRF